MRSTFSWRMAAAAGVAGAVVAMTAWAQSGRATLVPASQLTWVNAGIPGVQSAALQGDMKSGPSHFYLRYPAGFVAPVHFHSPDHFATTVSGQLVLITEGRETALPPGSHFAFTGKARHAARCEGAQDCVMFIDARGAWDVVADKH